MLQIAYPGIMLLAGLLFAGLFFWVFWPKKGLISLLARARLINKKVILEDTLKFIFDCTYKSLHCDLNGMAGHLGISTDRAAKLSERLHSMGLVTMKGGEIRLTDTGRSYALRIIRVHRIWERYLADETGFDQVEWHGEADLREHRMTQEDTDQLAARLGNPVYDPHGEPIPSRSGELPKRKGASLSRMKPGNRVRIIEVSDKPHSIYQQLVALGLYPGMHLYLLEVDQEHVRFVAEGDECVLTPLFASGIYVEPLPESASLAPAFKPLSSLKIGESAEIAGISPQCRGQQRKRLMDLGIVPGGMISAEISSPSGDPVAYRIMDAQIGIRKSQADHIMVVRKGA